ncbi:rhomboid family membrane protein-like protein [Xylogone sp. PMI_703]|nr:rhomboid family membrane protein-like protein [Xylogone sp. PMI_703]
MAANDYYNPQSSGHQPYQQYPDTYSEHSLPSYRTELPATQGIPPRTSPFEAPFDDHVYPLGAQGSQSSFGQDSRYYGQGGGGRPQDSMGSMNDAIPLRDQVPPKDNNTTDHVYDAGDAPSYLQNTRRNRISGFGGVLKKRGRIPWVVYIFTIVQVAVFIAEIVKNATLTKSPIEIHPSFNPMIGPSPWVLINMGARYVPCMHNVKGIQDRNATQGPISWGCPNTTDASVAECTLSQLCGFNGVPEPLYNGDINQSPQPNQWFRFIIPIFLHAGLIHIGFNMLMQLSLGREVEIIIGSIRFFLVYVSSGIFGFVLGGNFAATGIASTGASGALFGILAISLLDLLYTWDEKKRNGGNPTRDLLFLLLDIVISFVLGLLPGLDNFSHIGGFLMGLVLGICILHSPDSLRARIGSDPPYTPVRQFKDNGQENGGVTGFIKHPLAFFKGRKPAWWAWWVIRALALVGVFVSFILLLKNFYTYRKTCSWCKYLSCIVSYTFILRGDITNFAYRTSTTGVILEISS